MPRSRVVLADVDRPMDTSVLSPCDDVETAAVIEMVRARLLRRRRALIDRRARPGGIERIVGALRRLQNPHLAAYRLAANAVLVSEPFNAIPCAVLRAPDAAAYDSV